MLLESHPLLPLGLRAPPAIEHGWATERAKKWAHLCLLTSSSSCTMQAPCSAPLLFEINKTREHLPTHTVTLPAHAPWKQKRHIVESLHSAIFVSRWAGGDRLQITAEWVRRSNSLQRQLAFLFFFPPCGGCSPLPTCSHHVGRWAEHPGTAGWRRWYRWTDWGTSIYHPPRLPLHTTISCLLMVGLHQLSVSSTSHLSMCFPIINCKTFRAFDYSGINTELILDVDMHLKLSICVSVLVWLESEMILCSWYQKGPQVVGGIWKQFEPEH